MIYDETLDLKKSLEEELNKLSQHQNRNYIVSSYVKLIKYHYEYGYFEQGESARLHYKLDDYLLSKVINKGFLNNEEKDFITNYMVSFLTLSKLHQKLDLKKLDEELHGPSKIFKSDCKSYRSHETSDDFTALLHINAVYEQITWAGRKFIGKYSSYAGEREDLTSPVNVRGKTGAMIQYFTQHSHVLSEPATNKMLFSQIEDSTRKLQEIVDRF